MVELAKWDAWNQCRGIQSEEAEYYYVDLVEKLGSENGKE